ncbi:MAG: N-acetyltransferase family protein [Rubritepida sp.]|jgi:phosphinothricin acetyltransferase|nr:N-acetyltransferase family protein [Rubritepida sp.]MCU0944628.1 N-acetyltransferase family protein [Rubritepida sp.]
MLIREATEADLPAILAIYNEVIRTSTAVYRDEPVPLEERAAWYAQRRAQGFPVLAAERGGALLGFASYGDWRGAFPGYRHTVEHSVHVADGLRGQGVGRALLEALIPHAESQGMHVMLGAVDAANEASLRFHERLGFRRVAHFHEVGRKFGRWLDLVFVERVLGAR